MPVEPVRPPSDKHARRREGCCAKLIRLLQECWHRLTGITRFSKLVHEDASAALNGGGGTAGSDAATDRATGESIV
jgi:hypothetical protein